MESTGDPDPREVIGAIMLGDQLKATAHLGTGSFIGDGTVVLTNNHVVDGHTGQLYIAVIIGGEPQAFPLTLLEADKDRDLALLKVDGYTAANPLRVLFDVHVSYNTDRVVLEYAQTQQLPTGQFLLNPALRRGHKTRNVDFPLFGAIGGQNAFELSFPSLAGASGAPVMIENMPWTPPANAWGIVAVLGANNTFRALAGTAGEFLLPQGIGIDINHLKPLYNKVFA